MKSPEEVKREFVHQWLGKADSDLKAARHLLDGEAELSFGAAFHAQQAVEKFLKAVLVWHQVEFPKTHDIGRLVDLVEKADAALAGLIQDASALTPYGVDIRYPGDQPEPTVEQATKAVTVAERAGETILRHLPSQFGSARDESTQG